MAGTRSASPPQSRNAAFPRASRRSANTALITALLLPVALAGCSPAADEDLPTPTEDASDPSPLATYGSPAVGMDALISGTLRLRDGCLVSEGTDGSPTLLLFPAAEAEWDDGVLRWRDREYRDGDDFEAGGGGGWVNERTYIPPGCEDLSLWLVG